MIKNRLCCTNDNSPFTIETKEDIELLKIDANFFTKFEH